MIAQFNLICMYLMLEYRLLHVLKQTSFNFCSICIKKVSQKALALAIEWDSPWISTHPERKNNNNLPVWISVFHWIKGPWVCVFHSQLIIQYKTLGCFYKPRDNMHVFYKIMSTQLAPVTKIKFNKPKRALHRKNYATKK